MRKTTDANISEAIKQQLNALTGMENVNEVLSQFDVDCTDPQRTVENLINAIKKSPIQNKVTQTLLKLLRPPACTRQTCSWILTDSASMRDDYMKLYEIFLKQLDDWRKKSDLPLLIALDADVLFDALNSDRAKQLLREYLQKFNEDQLLTMQSDLKHALSNPPAAIKMFTAAIKDLKLFKPLNISENARNVYNYLTQHIVSHSLNSNSLMKLLDKVYQASNQSLPESVEQKLKELLGQPGIDDFLRNHPLKCYTLRLCLEGLLLTNPQAPFLESTKTILSNIIDNALQSLDGTNSSISSGKFFFFIYCLILSFINMLVKGF